MGINSRQIVNDDEMYVRKGLLPLLHHSWNQERKERPMNFLKKINHVLDKIGMFSKWVNIVSLIAVFVMTIITTS